MAKKAKRLQEVFVPGPAMASQFLAPSFAMPPGMPAQVPPSQEEILAQSPVMEVPVPEVAPVPYGSGRMNKQQVTGKQDVVRQAVRNINLTPEEVEEIANTYRSLPEYQEQKAGLDQIRDLILSRAGSTQPQVDLSPLMALTDAWTGSKFSGSYKKPADQSAFLTEQLGKLQTGRKDMAKGITDFIRASRAGVETDKLLQTLGVVNLAQANDPKPKVNPISFQNSARVAEKDVITASRKVRDKAEEFQKTYQGLDTLLANPNVQNIGIAKTRIAKVLAGDVGNIAIQEAERVFPKTITEELARLEAFVSNNPGKPVPPSLVENLKKVVNTTKLNARSLLEETYSAELGAYEAAKGGYGNVNVEGIFAPVKQSIKNIGGVAEKDLPKQPSLRDVLNELKSQAGKK